ncbi:hypothetical protein F5148DRAFT_1153053 [Russula earlei]|uniref:Uncharacterized protein n=1 Tax=Russula earlei TaxID=71964 RepID=A0ACC0TUE4_9AGAM|nr:hypothetical protein F5148DRAFT_1153053 [Russula earlei]
MYTINHAERALRQHDLTEKTLKRYSIPVLQELCVKCGIDVGGLSRPLKKPYIDALLIHHSRRDRDQLRLKIRLPNFLPQRVITLPRPDGTSEQSIANENRGHQQQEHSDEPASTFRFTQPTAAEHSHSEVDTFYVRHALTPAPTDDQEKMPDGNTDSNDPTLLGRMRRGKKEKWKVTSL